MMKMLAETITPVLPLHLNERHGWISIYNTGGQEYDQSVVDFYADRGQEVHKLSDLVAQRHPHSSTFLQTQHLPLHLFFTLLDFSQSLDGTTTRPMWGSPECRDANLCKLRVSLIFGNYRLQFKDSK